MDLGLYNKGQKKSAGAHGTLIDNWAEERALAEFSGNHRCGVGNFLN
jgi:hypothetical protein